MRSYFLLPQVLGTCYDIGDLIYNNESIFFYFTKTIFVVNYLFLFV